MTSSGPTFLSLIAAGLYGGVVLTCCAAAFTRQSPAHWRGWMLLAALFLLLAAVRLFDLEQALENHLREWMRASNSYGNRRAAQAPLAAVVVAIAGILGGGWLLRTARHARGRRGIALVLAQGAGMVMLALIALRLVSFHAIDALLYGPLKLNWVIDLGAALTVGGAALFYLRAVRLRRPRGADAARQ